MKRLFLILCACAGLCASAAAQPLVCTRPGTELEYAEYDAKGRLTGYTLTRVESYEKNDEGWLVVKNREQSFDAQRNPSMQKVSGEKIPLIHTEQIVVREEEMLLPFDELLSDLPVGEGVDISVSGNEYAIPFALEAGRKLPDAKIVVTVAHADRSVKMIIGITDREVLAREKIATPAGEYDAFALEETMTVKMMIFKATMKHRVWYVPGVGIVREEEHSKKGRSEGYSELICVRLPAQ